MRGKNSYIAMRKAQNGSVTIDNKYGNHLDGASAFSVSAMIRVQELTTDKSILKIDGLVEIGLRKEQLYVKMPGYPVTYSNSNVGSVEKSVWMHIGMTTDGSRVSLYINGVLNCSVFGTAIGVNTGNTVQIGTEFAGDIRSIYVFDECLDESAMKETMLNDVSDRIPLAWYDFTKNPAMERISNQKINLEDAVIKTFTSAVKLMGNSFLEVSEKDFNYFFPGYARTQEYSVQFHFMFHSGEDDQTVYYNLLSDMGIEGIGGVNIYLERMEDGFHLCYHHAFMEVDSNRLVSTNVIKQDIWTNVAIVFDIDTAYLYINGEIDTVLEQILPAFSSPVERRMLIGADRDDVEESEKDYFSGYIAQCDVWNKALTAEEVKKNIEDELDINDVGLGFLLDIDGDGCFNGLTEYSISMGNHAQVEEVLTATGLNVSESIYKAEAFKEPLSEEELNAVYEKCQREWINCYRESHEIDEGDILSTNSMPYAVKAWKKDGIVYFVECYQNKARTIDYVYEAEISDEMIWWAELILMIIGGVCAAVFGLYLGTGNRVVNKLVNVIASNTKLFTALKVMVCTDFSVELLINFFGLLYKENLVKKIFKIVLVSISFFSVLSICTKIASWALGYGWAAAAVQLAALVVEIGIHISNYPKKEDNKPDIVPITLSEINYTNVPIESADVNSIESLKLCKDGGVQSVAQGWRRDERQSFSYAAYDMERAGTHSIRMQVTYTPMEGCPDNLWIRATDTGEMKNTATMSKSVLGPSDIVKLNTKKSKKNAMNAVVTFNQHTIEEIGIGRIETTLNWEVSLNEGQTWKKSESSPLTIYVVLSRPSYQWENKALWIMALDYMCDAVQCCKDEDSLYQKVTETINGNDKLYYDMVAGASTYTTSYTYRDENKNLKFTVMELTFFLDDIKDIDVCIRVNCTDCASLVATFSNLFGGKLRCDWMTYSKTKDPENLEGFLINPIIAIGYSEFGAPNWGQGFSYHEVAMLHDTPKEDMSDSRKLYRSEDTDNTKHKIYDACLKINNGSNPESKPVNNDITKAKLPIKMSFSQYTDEQVINDMNNIQVMENDDSYREHLALKSHFGIDYCLVYYCNDQYSYKTIK